MSKRRKAFGRPQKSSSKKTPKRLAIKKAMLEALAKKRGGSGKKPKK